MVIIVVNLSMQTRNFNVQHISICFWRTIRTFKVYFLLRLMFLFLYPSLTFLCLFMIFLA